MAKYTTAAESVVWAEERGGRALPWKLRGFEDQQVMTNHLLREILKGIWVLVDLKHAEVSTSVHIGSLLLTCRQLGLELLEESEDEEEDGDEEGEE